MVTTSPRDAGAQVEETTAIPVQQYEAAPGVHDIMGMQSSWIHGHKEWQVGLQLNIADDVLEFRRLDDDTTVAKIIESQTGLDLMAAVGLWNRVELGVVLPITPYRTHGDPGEFALPSDLSAAALGDLRLVPKILLSRPGDKTSIAISAPISFPTGKDREFYGSDEVGVEPRLLIDRLITRGIRLAFNLGIKFHPTEKEFANLHIGHELTYALGVRVPFQVAGNDMTFMSSFVGSHVLAASDPEERTRELMVGVEYWPTDNVRLTAGGGPGLSSGYGTPDFRVLAGITVHGKPVEKPKCTYGPEDLDGFEDDDECADLDNDQDGIADEQDMCPNEPETVNQIDDQDGCPEDPLDLESTGDPLPELQVPQDRDGDGLNDEEDECPDEPEDVDGFEDADGCPDTDNDKDGITDVDDKCPLQAEIINGKEDEDGCPDEGDTLVKVTDKRIEILDKVYFDTNKATIQERSFNILDQVTAVLRANPQITKVRIEGHTDSRGKDTYNMTLSNNRAASVRTYLVDKGIAAERLDAQGFGETKPIDTNNTKAGRANNRRVEFHITEVNGEPVPEDAPTDTVESQQ